MGIKSASSDPNSSIFNVQIHKLNSTSYSMRSPVMVTTATKTGLDLLRPEKDHYREDIRSIGIFINALSQVRFHGICKKVNFFQVVYLTINGVLENSCMFEIPNSLHFRHYFD